MKCKYCGAELNEGELFCYRCGQQVEPEPAARYCMHCGAELEADAAFCWKCGASVDIEARQESDSTSAEEQDGAEANERRAKTEALVVAAQDGDNDSFTELYQLYYQKVFALAKTTVKSDADAEDVLQLTFLKAWDNLDKLKNPSAFSTWIQRITLNQCYSLLRKKHADVSIDNDDEDAEPIQLESDLMLPEVYAERSDLKARLGKIIRELSAVQQQTITLYYYDELPVENIAWIMDCSVNTVKSRLFLARKSIKTEIEEQERKSGQPFYGIIGLAAIPFGKLFVGQMESTALPESAAAEVLRAITKQIARRAAGAAGQAAGTAAKGAAKVGVKTATKTISTAVSRKIIAGIVAGALATGAIAGGTVAAVSAVRNNRAETAQAQSAEETPGTAANGPYGQDLPTVQPTEDDPRRQELQAAYQAYLGCLIENKSGIDNYIWQRGYAIPLFDDNDNSYEAPLTDEYLARPVVLCDICGDEIPELIYMGDVAPGEWKNEYYYNETGANLHIVTYRDGKLVSLFSSDESWDNVEYCFPYSLFQVEGGKELYATYAWGDIWEEDTLSCFREGPDGKLHQTQVCRYYFEEYETDDDGLPFSEPEHYYGADEAEIPKEEYDRIRNSKVDHISNALMYNYYGIWDVRPAVEQHGCPAMTCDEAIAYLQGLLREEETIPDPSQQELQAAYQAYLDCLIENKTGIDNYNWQKGYTVYLTDSGNPLPLTDDTLSRPVVLCDICGDAIPELIYVGDADEGFYGGNDIYDDYYNESVAKLHIVTCRNGKAVTLFVDDWDYRDGESKRKYDLFQINGNRELYMNTGDWEFYYYARFTEQPDGSLILSKVLYEEEIFADDDNYPIDYIYHGENGVVLSKEDFEYRKASMYSDRSALLMSSETSWDEKNKAFIQVHGCPAMTCDEAIAYLRELLNAGSQSSQPYAEAFRAYRDHLIAEQADIDSYVWQYEGWTDWYDWKWDEDNNTDYALRSDLPFDETTPFSRPVAVYDLVGDSTPELLYIRFDADAQLNYINMSHLVILTYRDGQLVTLFDREWEYMDPYEGASGFRIYAPASEQYGLLVQWFDGMTEWSLDVRDVFTYENGTMNRTQLLSHEQGYDEEADSEIHTYRLGDAEIDSRTYETYAEQWEQARGRLLLYSGNRERADYTESISMTCEEAIAWLTAQLGGDAPTVSLPADMPASFWQSSGVGAWSEDITFRADGTIVGEFHDTDAGGDGDGYDWTIDYCSYTCRIGSVRRINSYTYSFVVESVEYDHPIGKEEIVTDGGERIRYCYTDGSLPEGAEVMVYVRNAPIEAIPAPALELYESATAERVTGPMPCWVLYCPRTNGSFFSEP